MANDLIPVRDKQNAKLIPLVIALFGAFGSGFGSNYLWIKANPDVLSELARPDPFTGTQGRALERRIDSAAAELTELRNRVDRMSPEQVANRLAILELEVRGIKADMQKNHD